MQNDKQAIREAISQVDKAIEQLSTLREQIVGEVETLQKDYNGLTITLRNSRDGVTKGYVDILVDDSFCKAHGFSCKKEVLYEMGASAEQIHNEDGLPQYLRFWEDGRVTSTDINS